MLLPKTLRSGGERGSNIYRLLPKSLFAWSKTFFDKSKAPSRRCQNSPLELKQLTSLIFHFAEGFLAKKVLMTTQRDYGLGNSLFTFAPITSSMRVNKVAGKSVVFEQGNQLHRFVA
jgi:hypothetical protein